MGSRGTLESDRARNEREPGRWLLCAQPVGARLAVAVLVCVLLGGYMVSGVHMAWHYDKRDERAGLTVDDIRAAYAGLDVVSPIVVAVERRHPPGLPEAERAALASWLGESSVRIEQQYDNLDLGELAPSEIIAARCVECHSRTPTNAEHGGIGTRAPMETWADILPMTVSKQLLPKPRTVVAASVHAHAPSMAVMLLVLVALGLGTRVPRALVGWVGLAGALGLLADMAGQWLARDNGAWVLGILAGGAVYAASVAVVAAAVVIDCLLPAGRGTRA